MKKLMLGLVAAFAVTAFAAPSVKINNVETANPWDGTKGTIKVDYSLAGLDSAFIYEVAFDVTAKNETKTFTNAVARLADGTYTNFIDTAMLFGTEVVAKNANVKISLIAVELPPAGQLWEDGPIFAECNVGATKPEEYGYYFWWGDTVGYKRNANNNGWVSVKDATQTIQFAPNDPTAGQTCNKDADTLKLEGWTDDSGNLVVSDVATENHDAARAHLGAPWRMMTDAELQKLVNDCERTWVDNYKGKSVKGYVVTGKAGTLYANNEIFFPAAGYGGGSGLSGTGIVGHYRSSTPEPSSSNNAQYLGFILGSFGRSSGSRCNGFVVRPVRGSAE